MFDVRTGKTETASQNKANEGIERGKIEREKAY